MWQVPPPEGFREALDHLHERIGFHFVADGGTITVTGMHNYIFGQGVKFCFDAFFQYGKIAAGQIGRTDRSGNRSYISTTQYQLPEQPGLPFHLHCVGRRELVVSRHAGTEKSTLGHFSGLLGQWQTDRLTCGHRYPGIGSNERRDA